MADVQQATHRLALRHAALTSSAPSTRPRVVRGAERSRDEALTHHGPQKPSAIPKPAPQAKIQTLPRLAPRDVMAQPSSSSSVTESKLHILSPSSERISQSSGQDADDSDLDEDFARRFSLSMSLDGAADTLPVKAGKPIGTRPNEAQPLLQAPVLSRTPMYQTMVVNTPAWQKTDSSSVTPAPSTRKRYRQRSKTYSYDLSADDCVAQDELLPLLSSDDENEITPILLRGQPSKHDSRYPTLARLQRRDSISDSPRKRPPPPARITSFSTPNLGLNLPALCPTSLGCALSGDIHPVNRGPSISSVQGRYPSSQVPLMELLQDRLSPLERLEHEAAEQIARAPSVASFYSASSLPAPEVRLPTFDSPEKSPMVSSPVNHGIPSDKINASGPTPVTPSPTRFPVPDESDFQNFQTLAPTSHRSLPMGMRHTPVHRDFAPPIPPRITSRTHSGDRTPAVSAAPPRLEIHHRMPSLRLRGGGDIPAPPTAPRRHTNSIPSWQVNQENMESAMDGLMAEELRVSTARRRQESDERMDETPPREGRFERIASGSSG